MAGLLRLARELGSALGAEVYAIPLVCFGDKTDAEYRSLSLVVSPIIFHMIFEPVLCRSILAQPFDLNAMTTGDYLLSKYPQNNRITPFDACHANAA